MAASDVPLASSPRLAPLSRTYGLRYWLLALIFRVVLGKVITPAKVLYARMPMLVLPMLGMYRVIQSGLRLDPVLVHLIQLRVSQQNGCSFCLDLHRAMALKHGLTRARLRAAVEALGNTALTAAEQAALAYADEIRGAQGASDAAFEALKRHFDERQIVEITWLTAFTGYLNTMAKALNIGSDGFCEIGPEAS